MKYNPTPRDLFNPPPQARPELNNLKILANLKNELWVFPDTKVYILQTLIDILVEHDEHVYGVKS